MLLEKIEGLLKEVSTVTAQSAEDVERLRLKYLSKKGEINALMGEFRNVAADQKRAVGIKINELKQLAQSRINALKEQVEDQAAQSDDIDLTRTPYPVTLGTRHPLTLVKTRLSTYSPVWASRSIAVPRSTTTSTSSRCSTLPPTIPHATCRTLSSSTGAIPPT